MTNSTTVKSRKHEGAKRVVKKQAKTRRTAGVGKKRLVLRLRLWSSWEIPSERRQKASMAFCAHDTTELQSKMDRYHVYKSKVNKYKHAKSLKNCYSTRVAVLF